MAKSPEEKMGHLSSDEHKTETENHEDEKKEADIEELSTERRDHLSKELFAQLGAENQEEKKDLILYSLCHAIGTELSNKPDAVWTKAKNVLLSLLDKSHEKEGLPYIEEVVRDFSNLEKQIPTEHRSLELFNSKKAAILFSKLSDAQKKEIKNYIEGIGGAEKAGESLEEYLKKQLGSDLATPLPQEKGRTKKEAESSLEYELDKELSELTAGNYEEFSIKLAWNKTVETPKLAGMIKSHYEDLGFKIKWRGSGELLAIKGTKTRKIIFSNWSGWGKEILVSVIPAPELQKEEVD